MIYLSIPKRILSRNQLDSMHWGQRAKESKSWKAQVVYRLGGARIKPNAFRYALIVAYRHRALDHDNLVGGCKQLRDALVYAGLLHDDTDKWCKVDCRREPLPADQPERAEVYVSDETIAWPIRQDDLAKPIKCLSAYKNTPAHTERIA